MSFGEKALQILRTVAPTVAFQLKYRLCQPSSQSLLEPDLGDGLPQVRARPSLAGSDIRFSVIAVDPKW